MDKPKRTPKITETGEFKADSGRLLVDFGALTVTGEAIVALRPCLTAARPGPDALSKEVAGFARERFAHPGSV